MAWYYSYIIPIVILTALSAFFSASETAIFSISMPKVKALAHRGVPNAKTLEDLKNKPKRLLIAILVGNNLVNITASALATVFFMSLLGASGAAVAAATMTAVLITFGEILPKSYASHHAEKVSLRASRPIATLIKILTPVNFVFLKVMRFYGKEESSVGREEEIKALVNIGVEEGEMGKSEKELIENVLQFQDITVEEVMTTRNNITSANGGLPISKAIRMMLSNEYSRYPVYDKEKDNIVGVVHIKDALVEYMQGNKNKKVSTLASTPIFVPEHKGINDMMKEFQDKRTHMAVVVNNHGEVVGIVTLEDLIEEIVGEIIDESDVTKTMIKRIDKDTVLLHGMTILKDLKQFIHLNLTGNKNDTINAVILKKLRMIPKEGDEFTIEGNEITVVEANPKQIVKLKLKRTYKA